MRAALSTAVLVGLNFWLHWPPMMEAALAALLTCLCDAGGPVSRRVPALLGFAFIGAVFTAGFGLLRGLGYGVIPLACAVLFALCLVRVYGQAAQQVGNLLAVVLMLSLDRTQPDLRAALTLAGAFALGSLWAVFLTLVIWRLHPYRPVRRAVADVYVALAELAEDLRRLLHAGVIEDADFERHSRTHRRRVRDSIEAARAVVEDTLRQRGAASARAAQSLIRLEAADQIFGAVIALTGLLDADDSAPLRAAAERLLAQMPPLLDALARSIVADDTRRLDRVEAGIDAMMAMPLAREAARLRPVVGAIGERLRIARTLSTPAGLLAGASEAGRPREPWRDRLAGPLRANLDWQSTALRHALRAATVLGPGLLITFTWPGPYQHWLTITTVLTMQPYYATTLQRAFERIGGTMLGGVLAAALTLICRTPASIAIALFPLAVISLSLRAVSFAAFITFITPLIVLLSELGRPGVSELQIAAMRALYTLIGGLLAVGGLLVLWPSWEPDRLPRELHAALDAHARYLDRALALLLGEADAAAVERARQAAGIASNNLEASLSRALQEPGGRRRAWLQSALLADAAMRRMVGRLSAMLLEAAGATPEPESLRAWRDWSEMAMARVEQPGEALPPRPPAPQDASLADSLARVARQIELMAGSLARHGAVLQP